MINSKQRVLIKKDFRSVVSNKNLMTALIIVPLIFTVVLPTIFILAIAFTPDEMGDFEQLLEMLPASQQLGDMTRTMIGFLLNNIMPGFFALIPIMASSITAASSFVGEKEKRTLETLLYAPLTLSQIFQSKVLASFLLSMVISVLSFIAMIFVSELLIFFTLGSIVLPGISWLFTILVVAPAVSLLAIVFIVGGSAKAQTMEESQQRTVFLILPLILLIGGQFSGIVLINAWYLLALGTVIAIIAFILLKNYSKKFTYELLLKK